VFTHSVSNAITAPESDAVTAVTPFFSLGLRKKKKERTEKGEAPAVEFSNVRAKRFESVSPASPPRHQAPSWP
jgi:hypothetical protein